MPAFFSQQLNFDIIFYFRKLNFDIIILLSTTEYWYHHSTFDSWISVPLFLLSMTEFWYHISTFDNWTLISSFHLQQGSFDTIIFHSTTELSLISPFYFRQLNFNTITALISFLVDDWAQNTNQLWQFFLSIIEFWYHHSDFDDWIFVPSFLLSVTEFGNHYSTVDNCTESHFSCITKRVHCFSTTYGICFS